jgi:hydrogenase/urease accessory protein HupE/outer membrane cobalamin receptor
MAQFNKKSTLAGAALLFTPFLASAHPGHDSGGLASGFTHPLLGWDHLLVMLAVGIWAAQKFGAARWQIPAAFVGAMMLGGSAGAMGFNVPGVEFLIMLSVPVVGWIVIERVKLQNSSSAALAAFFAFFHGVAHGSEMPVSTSVLPFVIGFAVATVLLQGLGFVLARVAVGLFAMASGKVFAQTTTNAEPLRLSEIVVEGRADSLLGSADSATQGTVGAAQLAERPTLRPGEILETVPGVIITQHAGGGKANQYFLRGFNLDHGTDFATFIDGMPLNLPTHGHGQGYSDMNIVIPELVQRVNYQKGAYYAENGDFSSAGATRLEFFKVLPQSIATIEGGSFGYGRAMFAASPKVGEGNLLYAGEYLHNDGPWTKRDDFNKFNGQLTYSQGDDTDGFSLTARAYRGEWDSSDQIAESAVASGLVSRFGSLDNTTGGDSQRYSLQGEWHRADNESATKVMAYTFYYDMDLFSDFTYFLNNPLQGDQFEQADRRWASGLEARHTLFGQLGEREMENTFGLQVRNDVIRNGLYNTQGRGRYSTTRADDVLQTSLGTFWENKVQWAEQVRSTVGLRGDVYRYDVDSTLAANSDDRYDGIASPKATLVFGPWAKTEVYGQGGLGFHSNDGRGATTTIDPTSLTALQRADPLVQTYGAEVGIRTLAVDGLQSTLSVWWLDIDSELLFFGDAGATEASRPSRRYGIEWANFYNVTKNLTFDFDVSFSHAKFRTSDPAGDHIPGSIENVVAAGVTYRADCGFFGSVRLRYFGPRPLIEDDSVRSPETILVNAQVGYHFNQTWTATVEVLNLLNRKDHDISYFYESQTTPGSTPTEEIHFHPVEPIQVRAALTAQF